jgi:hypothetical protein
VYTGIIEIPKRSTEQPNTDGPFTVIARAYVFSKKVLHATFCNAVVDAFVGMHVCTRTVQFPGCIKIVYEKTAASSPMRRLFADNYAYSLADDFGLTDVLEGFLKEFLVDLIDLIATRVRNKTDEDWSAHLEQERYHKAVKEGIEDGNKKT